MWMDVKEKMKKNTTDSAFLEGKSHRGGFS